MTLAAPPFGTSRRWISTSGRPFHHYLEHCDVGSRHRDVGVIASLSRRDVDIQCRDVGNSTLWNVATLSLNVVTLSSNVTTLSPNVETLPLFYDKRPSYFGPPHAQPRRNPPAPSLLPNSYHSVAFATTGLIAPPPVLRTCLESPSPPP